MIREYSVFISNIYVPWELYWHTLHLRKNPERHAYHIKHGSKDFEFTFYNTNLLNQKNQCVSAAFLCVTAS